MALAWGPRRFKRGPALASPAVRKVKERETANDHYACIPDDGEPDAEVGPTHPKAKPVILTTPEEVETWMTAAPDKALQLQRPLPGWLAPGGCPPASKKTPPDWPHDRRG